MISIPLEGYAIARQGTAGFDAQLFLLNIGENVGNINYALLPPRQVAGCDRFKIRRDAEKRLLARSFLYELCAGEYGLSDFELATGPFGKPFLKAKPQLRFSFSYSDDYLLIGLSEKGKIGVDIVCPGYNLSTGSLAREIMHEEELRRYNAFEPDDDRKRGFLFRTFAAKEAIVKAFGTGFHSDLKSLNTLEQDSFWYEGAAFRLDEISFGEYPCAMAVCCENPTRQ